MKTIRRYITLYILFFRINLTKVITDRAGFANDMVSVIVWSFFSIFSILLVTAKTKAIFGWTREDLLILGAMYNIFIGIFHFLFSGNFNEFVYTIHFGELDTILVKPVDTQFFLSFRYIRYTNCIRAIIGAITVWFLFAYLHISVSLIAIVNCAILLSFGIAMLYAIWFSVLTITVRFSSLSNLTDFLYTMSGILRYPKEVYQNSSIVIFILLFPLTVLLSTPVKGLLSKVQLSDAIILFIITIATVIFSRIWWKFSLRFYTSAGG